MDKNKVQISKNRCVDINKITSIILRDPVTVEVQWDHGYSEVIMGSAAKILWDFYQSRCVNFGEI